MKETQLVPTVETILSLMEMISTALWCVSVCVCVCVCVCVWVGVCAELVHCYIHVDLHDNHVYTIAHPLPWECLLLTLNQ